MLCVVKWYGIIDKVIFEMAKWNICQKPDANTLAKTIF